VPIVNQSLKITSSVKVSYSLPSELKGHMSHSEAKLREEENRKSRINQRGREKRMEGKVR